MSVQRLVFSLVLLVFLPASGGALTIGYSGPIPGEDGGGLIADVEATFTWVEGCDTNCTLTVVLTYNSVSGGTLNKPGQVLSGVIFEPVLTGGTSKDLFGLNVGGTANTGSGSADLGSSGFVGTGAAQAASDLGTNVSPHWGFHPNLQFGIQNDLGPMLLSSVGDITFAGAFWDQDGDGVLPPLDPDDLFTTGLGTTQLLAGSPSSVELNPPNGIDFGIVPTGTCPGGVCPDPLANDVDDMLRALIENSVTFQLSYTGGQLTGITQANFLFGTDGNVPEDGLVPEPSAITLLAAGLLGLAWTGRRR